jgi:hypothetical protein
MHEVADLCDELNCQRSSLFDMVNQLPDALFTMEGIVGRRSMQHALAHLAIRDRRLATLVATHVAAETLPPGAVQTPGEDLLAQTEQMALHTGLTPREQLQECATARDDLLQHLRRLGDAGVRRSYPWIPEGMSLAGYIEGIIIPDEQDLIDALRRGLARLKIPLFGEE